jgi:uncharacterized protein
MTTYIDSSALLKCYIDDHDSAMAEQLVDSDPVRATSWVTYTEVRRNLARHLDGTARRDAYRQFEKDFDQFAAVTVDETICRTAATIGETLGVRSLDAIHLASAQRLLITGLTFITFDLSQAQAARSLGFHVLGA